MRKTMPRRKKEKPPVYEYTPPAPPTPTAKAAAWVAAAESSYAAGLAADVADAPAAVASPASPPAASALIHVPADRILHSVAKCRWCGGPFMQIDRGEHWICATEACAARQLAHAMMPIEKRAFGSAYLYIPLPLAVDVAESPVTHLLVAGAAGVSKSYGGRWWLYAMARKVSGYRGLLMRATYPEFDRNHGQHMEAEGVALGDMRYSASSQGPDARTAFFRNDARIVGGSCETDNHLTRHLGAEWDGLFMDEGVTFRSKALNQITPRARGSKPARPAMLALGLESRSVVSTNPGGRSKRYLVEFYITKNPDPEDYPEYTPEHYGYITGTLEDNPYLAPDYERKFLSGLDAVRYRELRYGDWTVMSGQFFDKFSTPTHVKALDVP